MTTEPTVVVKGFETEQVMWLLQLVGHLPFVVFLQISQQMCCFHISARSVHNSRKPAIHLSSM